MPTDQLLKTVLQSFFKEFMTLFFPSIAARIDFSSLTFLDKEIFTDLVSGDRREVDFLARVRTWSGEEEYILIHIEIQAQSQADFPKRMFDYFPPIRRRHGLPVLPIALHLHRGIGGLTRQVYEERAFDEVVIAYHYRAIGLPELSSKEYLERNDPLAVGLSAFMAGKRGERVRRKAETLRRLLELEAREAHRFLLVNLVETGLTLRPTEEEEFQKLTETPAYTEVKQMRLIYEEHGLVRGKREAVIELLEFRYGSLPEILLRKIEAIETPEEAREWLGRALRSTSLADLGSDPAN